MDLSDNTIPIKFKQCAGVQCPRFQSTTSSMITNSFDNVGSRGTSTKDTSRKSNCADVDINDDGTYRPSYVHPHHHANKLIGEILNIYDINKALNLNQHDDYVTKFDSQVSHIYQQKSASTETYELANIVSSKSTVKGSRTNQRHSSKQTFNKENTNFSKKPLLENSANNLSKHISSAKARTQDEKYVVTPSSKYDKEFVLKSLQRNARLQNIYEKMVAERQQLKQKVWDNFINNLKRKHGYDMNKRLSFKPLNDNTLHNSIDSSVIEVLLNDFYFSKGILQPNDPTMYMQEYERTLLPSKEKWYLSQHECYPTTLNGRYLIARKKRNELKKCVAKPPSNLNSEYNSIIGSNLISQRTRTRVPSSSDTEQVQAVRTLLKEKYYNKRSKIKNKELINTDNNKENRRNDNTDLDDILMTKLKNICQCSYSMQNVAQKLDVLIESFNKFALDMREKNRQISKNNSKLLDKSNSDESCKPYVCGGGTRKNKSNDVSFTKVPQYHKINNSEISEISIKTPPVKDSYSNEAYNKAQDNLSKNNIITKTIEDLFMNKKNEQCSTHITITIPAKEICTQVSTSLCRSQRSSKEDFIAEEVEYCVNEEHREYQRMSNMTIAVNTEPLGLFALLRVSVDAVKQFLSYVPYLNNYPLLALTQHHGHARHYVCNICGAAFIRPSYLSDHIQRHHNLGRTRDCCICHNVVDLQQSQCSLFKCRYCGQRFARAYCCELHQQTCAKHHAV